MSRRKRFLDWLMTLCILGNGGLYAQDAQELWTPGSFSGWHIIVLDAGRVAPTDQEVFTWEDSVLHVYGAAAAGSEQVFAELVTDSLYANYRLMLEYRWGKKKFRPRHEFVRDAGVVVHVFDTTAFWASGIECQIQEGDTGDAWLIGARGASTVQPVVRNFDPDGRPEMRGGEAGQRFARFHRAYSWERPGWNEVVIEAIEDTVSFLVNGHLVNRVTRLQRPSADSGEWVPLRRGHILLQAEGAEVFYRRLRLTPLPLRGYSRTP